MWSEPETVNVARDDLVIEEFNQWADPPSKTVVPVTICWIEPRLTAEPDDR